MCSLKLIERGGIMHVFQNYNFSSNLQIATVLRHWLFFYCLAVKQTNHFGIYFLKFYKLND